MTLPMPADVQMTDLCLKPDGSGRFNRRCRCIMQRPRGETEPRQCKAAAETGVPFCSSHRVVAHAR